jgi:ferritin-like metal-binding protein YciE
MPQNGRFTNNNYRELTMSLDTLEDAFYDELCDIYHAEKQLVRALPKMAKKASSEDLKAAFEAHLEETEEHVARVEAAFEDTGKAPKAKKCEAMEGLIEEAKSMMEEDAEPEVMDAILIGCAQKVEHYEIATYGTLCTWAELLGYKNAKKNLGANHGEEEKCDQKLTKLSKAINLAAK